MLESCSPHAMHVQTTDYLRIRENGSKGAGEGRAERGERFLLGHGCCGGLVYYCVISR